MKNINLTKTISLEYGKQEGRILSGNKILAKFYSCTDGLLVTTDNTPPVPYDWKPSEFVNGFGKTLDIGDKVKIIDKMSNFYGRVGKLHRILAYLYWEIKFKDGWGCFYESQFKKL